MLEGYICLEASILLVEIISLLKLSYTGSAFFKMDQAAVKQLFKTSEFLRLFH